MQVERRATTPTLKILFVKPHPYIHSYEEGFSNNVDKVGVVVTSGKRVSNTLVTYLEVGESSPKAGLISDGHAGA